MACFLMKAQAVAELLEFPDQLRPQMLKQILPELVLVEEVGLVRLRAALVAELGEFLACQAVSLLKDLLRDQGVDILISWGCCLLRKIKLQ